MNSRDLHSREGSISTYSKAGVDIRLGDLCSTIAYSAAKSTFGARKGKIGCPRNVEGGFSSLLDMGEFYLCFNSDGIGSKVQVAQTMNQHHTLGYDLVAMVADDAVCVGADPVAMVNTLDMERVDEKVVAELMEGLEKAANETGIAVVGGEIAEMRGQVKGYLWSASLIGVLKKNRIIDGSSILCGDKIVALLTDNFRSNGMTLVRRVLEGAYGPWWHKVKYEGPGHTKNETWGEKILAPSKIYAPFIVKLIGNFNSDPLVEVHGIAHITGGGLKHNIKRIIPNGFDIKIYNLPSPPAIIARVKDLGKITNQEAYSVWNMGIGMAIVTPQPDLVLNLASENKIDAQIIGEVILKKDSSNKAKKELEESTQVI